MGSNNRIDSFRDLLSERRVILCAGSGGVGKTTTTASLGLLAASDGKRVLCLTIDPARRLAESLGLEELNVDAQSIDRERLTSSGFDVTGSLTVMMLDTQDTFDGVVRKYASSDEAAERILNNRIYQYVSRSLAGTQEYMAMEKLHEVAGDSNYDVVILDTPPTSHALDFLDAPERLIDAVDGSATRWIIKAFRRTGGMSFDVLAKPAAMALRGVGKFTGKGFLEQVAGFLTDIHELFGGFTERARAVQQVLRSPDVAYVLVASPTPNAVQEVLLFADRLTSMGTSVDAVIVNRFHDEPPALPTREASARVLRRHDVSLGEDGFERLEAILADELVLHQADSMSVKRLARRLSECGIEPLRATVPNISHDVHDLETLAHVAEVLGGASRTSEG